MNIDKLKSAIAVKRFFSYLLDNNFAVPTDASSLDKSLANFISWIWANKERFNISVASTVTSGYVPTLVKFFALCSQPPINLSLHERIWVREATRRIERQTPRTVEAMDTLLEQFGTLKASGTEFCYCVDCATNLKSTWHEFSTSQVVSALNAGNELVCPRNHSLSAQSIAPDLAFEGLSVIDSKDLQYVRPLGKGSFAAVKQMMYQGRNTAVKELTDQNGLREMTREAMLMSRLANSRLVGIHGICLKPLSIVTEFMEGGDLFTVLQTHKDLGWNIKLRMARDVALAMAFLHSRVPPIVHRDLKTPNVLVGRLSAEAVQNDAVLCKLGGKDEHECL